MKINRIIVKNIGPIDNADLILDGKSVVFAGENGSGKTILISAIVDFIHEHLREIGFDDIMPQKGLGYSYFRMTSEKFRKNGQAKGFIWVDGTIGKEKIKYLECYGYNNKEELSGDLKVPIEDIVFPDDGSAKKVEGITNRKKQNAAKRAVINESIFYLPATRFEKEFWKTDVFADISFKEEGRFANSLGRSIELTSSLGENYSWLLNLAMDMLLDERARKIKGDPVPTISEIYVAEVCKIISLVINKKIKLSISKDYSNRLSLVDNRENLVVPSLSMLSLGQLLTMNIFLNIMRLGYGKAASDICGIVVIDEIDTHLHIRLQNEVLPELMKLFPKIQFIITTHSHMFLMGLKTQNINTKIINLPDAQEITSDDFSELNIALEKMEQTKRYIASINDKIRQEAKPVLLVEDKYTEIYKVAWLKLNDIDFDEKSLCGTFDKKCPFEIYGKNGKESLFKYLDQQKMDEIHNKKIVGLFDFDGAYNDFNGLKKGDRWGKEEGDDSSGIYKVRQDYPNVSATLIPVPDFRSNIADSTDLKEGSLLEIELLFRDEKILHYCNRKKMAGGGEVLRFKSENKKDFWKEAISFEKNDFYAFIKLFELIEKLLNVSVGK